MPIIFPFEEDDHFTFRIKSETRDAKRPDFRTRRYAR